MAAKPCAVCEGSKNASVHSRYHPDYHAYSDSTKAGLQPMSRGMREFREQSGYQAAAAAARGRPCQIMSPFCTGLAEALHEVLPRGRAGGLRASLALAPTVEACNACNSYVTGDGLVWGREHGFVVSRKDLGLDRIGERS